MRTKVPTQLQKIYMDTEKMSHDAVPLWMLTTTGLILKTKNIYNIIYL